MQPQHISLAQRSRCPPQAEAQSLKKLRQNDGHRILAAAATTQRQVGKGFSHEFRSTLPRAKKKVHYNITKTGKMIEPARDCQRSSARLPYTAAQCS